jgi:pseudouridine kinase
MNFGTLNRIDAMLSKPYVLAIGAANMDLAASTTHGLALGDSTPGMVRSAPGGVARNVAENLARLGLEVCLLSPVGDDLQGRGLLERTREAGVDVDACWTLHGERTSSYVSLHGADGDMVAAINDMTILERVTPEQLAHKKDLLTHAEVFFLDCNLPEAALEWLFLQARDRPVFVDPVSAFKCRRVLPWLGRVHTLKANRLEAQALWGQPVNSDLEIEAAARWLHAQGVQQVVLSLGARGLYWSAGNSRSGWQPAIPVPVVNATGAGDALMAGLLHQHLRDVPLEQAVVFSAGCAAFTLAASQANHPGLSVAGVRHLLDSMPLSTPGPASKLPAPRL